ncbi:MAG: WD40 repeat domain-containing protein [Byssovorax sp.]
MTRARLAIRVAALGLASFVAGCGGNVELPVKGGPAPGAMPGACTVAVHERARLAGLLGEGKLDRALRVAAKANGLCPGERSATWHLEVEALAEIGRYADARALAATIAASPTADTAAKQSAARALAVAAERDRQFPATDEAKTPMREGYRAAQAAEEGKKNQLAKQLYLDAWSKWRPNGQALYGAGHNALQLGETAEAQRLFDRAIVELERVTGAGSTVDFPNGFSLASRAQWSPDGRLLAVVTEGNKIALIGFPTRREWLRITGHAGRISSIAFSPDSKSVASASADGTIELWEVASGQLVRSLHGQTGVIAFSPDGGTLASGTAGGTLELFDLTSGSEPMRVGIDDTGPAHSVGAIAFSPDGSLVAWGCADGTIRSWSLRARAPRPSLLGHTGKIRALAFSPGGRVLASGSSDHTVRTWNIPSGTPGVVDLHGDVVTMLAFTPNGKTIVSVCLGESAVHVWSTTSDQETGELQIGHSDVESISVSPDGTTLAVASFDDVQLWSLSTAQEGPGFKRHADRLSSIGISPDGALLASTSIGTTADTVRVWTLGATEAPRIIEGELGLSLAFTPDSTTLAIGGSGGQIDVRDLSSGKRVQTLAGHEGRVRAVTFSRDGGLLASGSDDRTVRLWSMPTGKLVARLDHEGAVASVAFTADGLSIASGGAEPGLHLWDVVHGRPLAYFPATNAGSHPLALSPDGHTLASEARSGVLAFWEITSKSAPRDLAGQQGLLSAVAFSPDGSTIASGSIDGTLRLRSADPTSTETPPLRGHLERITGLAYSPQGSWVASSSWDGTVRLWSVPAGEQLVALRAIRGRQAGYAFAPTGHVEMYGAKVDDIPICRVGVQSFPFELCRERFLVPGLRARVLAGDRAYLEP